ncbi:MAG: hypothetical protein ACLSG8_07060 [Barnesiella sp.]
MKITILIFFICLVFQGHTQNTYDYFLRKELYSFLKKEEKIKNSSEFEKTDICLKEIRSDSLFISEKFGVYRFNYCNIYDDVDYILIIDETSQYL